MHTLINSLLSPPTLKHVRGVLTENSIVNTICLRLSTPMVAAHGTDMDYYTATMTDPHLSAPAALMFGVNMAKTIVTMIDPHT
jgi:hypothetical protein